MRLTLILSLAAFFTTTLASRFVCYYGSWSVYRHGPAKFQVEDIDPHLCTHLIYTFVGLSNDGRVKILDHYNDIGDDWHEGAYKKLRKLRSVNPNLKILCAIGGWNEGSVTYSYVVNNPALRKVMVKSILNFTLEHKFDGFDLDWEYPNQRGGIPADREAFSALVAELQEAFRPHNLILSAAVSANALTVPGSYNCGDLARHLDFINVMTYDLHGSWERVTGHHTAMYAHPIDQPGEKHLNIDAALKHWVKCTGAPEKLNIGLATYGRTFTLTNANDHGIGAPTVGPGPGGSYVNENGFLGYNEICMEQRKGLWTMYNVPEQNVKYAVKDRVWVGYDDAESIIRKLEYARSLNIGGAMVWSIETDDFRGDCGMGKYPLLTAIKNFVLPNGPQPSTTQSPKPSPTSPTTLPTISTTQKPTVTPPPTQPSTTHIPPPNEDFSYRCYRCGQMFRHPEYSNVFYICTYGLNGLIAVKFNCPAGLVFYEQREVCDYP